MWKSRSIAYWKSDGFTSRFTGGPNITPLWSWNEYVRPASATCGIAVAMSGTTSEPAGPAAFRNVTRPLFVASRISQPSTA